MTRGLDLWCAVNLPAAEVSPWQAVAFSLGLICGGIVAGLLGCKMLGFW